MTVYDKLVATSFRGPSFGHIRITAAVVVLLHHCRNIEYSDIRFDPLFRYSGGEIHFGLLAVLVFFAISGFLVTPSLWRSENVINFAANRILRIFPALIVVVIASIALLGPALTTLPLDSYFLDPGLYRYSKNVLTLTQDYLPGVVNRDGDPIVINGALWTLHFEVLSYATLALTSMIGILRRRDLMLILCLACYGIHLAMTYDPILVAALPQRFLTFMRLFVYFGAGALLFIFADRIPFSGVVAFGALALTVLALPVGLGAVVLPLCVPYMIVFCGLSALPGQPLLKHDLSYGVYLIHAPMVVALSLAFPNLQVWWLAAAIVLLITLAVSYLSWIFVERPALKQKEIVSDWLNRQFDTRCSPWLKARMRVVKIGRIGTS